MPTVCPQCHKDDEMWKLTTVVSHGKASGTYSGPSSGVTRVDGESRTIGGYTRLHGSTKTELARKLEPPKEPKQTGCMEYLLLPPALLFGLFFCLGGVAVLIGGSNGNVQAVAIGVLAVGAGLGGWALVSRGQGAILKASEPEYREQKEAWEAAMEKYNRSYYCFRDNLVFDPQTQDTCDPDELTSFLYSKAADEHTTQIDA